MELNNLYSKGERRERARRLLETVEMAGQADKMPAAISGGQQQRVAIARALANAPPLIVADEPTGNLDAKNGMAVLELLRRVCTEGKHTLLLVTHDPQVMKSFEKVV